MAKIASRMKAGDLLLVCITGGGSALLTLPAPLDPAMSPTGKTVDRLRLDAIKETTKMLSLNGASIQEVFLLLIDLLKFGACLILLLPSHPESWIHRLLIVSSEHLSPGIWSKSICFVKIQGVLLNKWVLPIAHFYSTALMLITAIFENVIYECSNILSRPCFYLRISEIRSSFSL